MLHFFIYVIWMTVKISLTETPVIVEKTSILHDLLEGFRYMAANRRVLYLVVMALIIIRHRPALSACIHTPS